MFRVDRVWVLAFAGLIGACGSPPAPPATAPPPPAAHPSASSAPLPPPVLTTLTPAVPTTIPAFPTYTVPTTTTPAPVYTPPVVVTPATTTPGPSPAPRCGPSGPTAAQLVAVVEGTNGIPDRPLKVVEGPFCSGSWQFSVMELQANDAEDEFEPLFVVTKGQPTALQLVEAGTDICSSVVQNDSPPSVRVRACGA